MSNSTTSNFQNHGSYKFDNYGQTTAQGKMGKGYSNDTDKKGIPQGKPKGVHKGKCTKILKYHQTIYGKIPQICTGTIIAVKISTNQRGFETSTEMCCDFCGKVYPTAFQVLGKEEPTYKTQYWNTHEEWLHDNKSNQILKEAPETGIDPYLENFAHLTGHRLNTTDFTNENRDYGSYMYGSGNAPYYKRKYKINNEYAKRLAESTKRVAYHRDNINTTPSKDWIKIQHKEYADECRREYEFTKSSYKDICYFIDKYGIKYFHRRTSYQEIIYDIFVYLDKRDMRVNCKNTYNTIITRVKHVIHSE